MRMDKINAQLSVMHITNKWSVHRIALYSNVQSFFIIFQKTAIVMWISRALDS